MTPRDFADIDEAVLDMARENRLAEWEESHADEAEAAEHLDLPLIEIVWDAGWNAAVEAVTALRSRES